MMKKRLFAAVLSAVILGTLVLPVYAQNMDVTYRHPNEYTVTIPGSITLSEKGSETAEIKASNVNIEPGKEVTVSISTGIDADGNVRLSRENDSPTGVQSTISLDGATAISAGTVVAKFTGSTNTPSEGGTLHFSEIRPVSGKDVKAGTYKGTLTFTITAPDKN